MSYNIKHGSAANTPIQCLTISNKNQEDHNTVIEGLQDIRDMAWHLAMKYRFDPTLSVVHEEYLTLLNRVLKEFTP